MSYILDALRKSEQERLRGQAVASLGQSVAPTVNPRRYLIISALLGANLVLVALLGWWWSGRAQQPVVAASVAVPAPLKTTTFTTTASSAPLVEQTYPARSNQLPENTVNPPAFLDATPSVTLAPRMRASPRRDERIAPAPYSDRYVRPLAASDEDIEPPPAARPVASAARLPRGIPSNFPPLSLSTHIYSSDPGSRTVVINGMRLSQGDGLANGVEVVEITEDGARVRYQGQEAMLNIAH